MNHDEIEAEELRRHREEELIAKFERGSGFGTSSGWFDNKEDNQEEVVKIKSKPKFEFNRVHRHNFASEIARLDGVEMLYFIKKFKLIRVQHIHAVIVHPVGSDKLSDTSFKLDCAQLTNHQQVSQSEFINEINNNFNRRFE